VPPPVDALGSRVELRRTQKRVEPEGSTQSTQ
jgi:hypothetical protein